LLDITRSSKVISGDDEFLAATGSLKSAKDFQDVVLRLQAAHYQVIAVLRKVPLCKRLNRGGSFDHIAAVSNY
jgi:hypothetical protein